MPLIDWRQLSQLGGNFVHLLINISSLRRKGKRLFIFYLPAINELISGKGVEGNSEGELPGGKGVVSVPLHFPTCHTKCLQITQSIARSCFRLGHLQLRACPAAKK